MAEQTFLSSGSVTVTQARFVVDGQTYAMQGVTSVRRELAQPSKKGPIIAVLFGVIAVFVSFALFSSSIGTGIVLLLIGVGIIAAGVFWFRGLKATHFVILNSASGESRALWSKDESFIAQVVDALNNAIIARG